MLIHPTLQKLSKLKLEGFTQAFQEQLEQGLYHDLSFEERLGLMVDREFTLRDNRGFERRLKAAKLRHDAALENVDFKHPRKLDGALVRSLATGSWIREKRQVLITGPTGTGKTYLTSALGHAACRQGFTVLYAQMGKLLPDLAVQRGAGRYAQSLKRLSKVDVLLLDDWGLEPLSNLETRILLELLDDRYERSSTLIASQFPTDAWYGLLNDPTLADAILDRILHGAYRLELQGESLRKMRSSHGVEGKVGLLSS